VYTLLPPSAGGDMEKLIIPWISQLLEQWKGRPQAPAPGGGMVPGNPAGPKPPSMTGQVNSPPLPQPGSVGPQKVVGQVGPNPNMQTNIHGTYDANMGTPKKLQLPGPASGPSKPSAPAPAPTSAPGRVKPTPDHRAMAMSNYNMLKQGKYGSGTGAQNNANWGTANQMPDFETWYKSLPGRR